MSSGSMRARAGVEPQPRLDELALAVAADRERAVAERAHGVDRLARERAAGDVAADHDQVDAERVDLGEHGRQGGVVPVDVVERRDPHGRQRYWRPTCTRLRRRLSLGT